MARLTQQDAETALKNVLPKYKATIARAEPLVKKGKLPLATVALVEAATVGAQKIAADCQDADALPEFAAGDLHAKIVSNAKFLNTVLDVVRDAIMLAEMPEDTLPC